MTDPNQPKFTTPEYDNDDETGDWRLAAQPKPVVDRLGFWSMVAAAAIVLPIAWWAKENLHIADWLRGIFGH